MLCCYTLCSDRVKATTAVVRVLAALSLSAVATAPASQMATESSPRYGVYDGNGRRSSPLDGWVLADPCAQLLVAPTLDNDAVMDALVQFLDTVPTQRALLAWSAAVAKRSGRGTLSRAVKEGALACLRRFNDGERSDSAGEMQQAEEIRIRQARVTESPYPRPTSAAVRLALSDQLELVDLG